MPRIYQSEQMGRGYQGSAQSVGFNPEIAVSDERRVREYGAARVQDAETIGREISRQMQLESNQLQLQQGVDRGAQSLAQSRETGLLQQSQLNDKSNLALQQAHQRGYMALQASQLQGSQSVDRANTQAFGTAVSSLLSLSSSYVAYQGEMYKQQKKDEENNKLFDATIGKDFWEKGAQLPDNILQESKQNDTALKAESTAINNVAAPLASSKDPTDISAATQLQTGTTWNQLSSVRGNVYAAAAMIPAALAEFAASGQIRAGAQGYEDTRMFLRKFFDATGLLGADKALVAEVVLRPALGLMQNAVLSATMQEAKGVKEAYTETTKAKISDLADGSTVENVGSNFTKASEESIHAPIGFNGKHSAASNLFTVKEFLTNLVAEGKTKEITALRDHVYNASTGRKLGDDYDHLFDEAEQQARKGAIARYELGEAESKLEVKKSIQYFYDNPSPENRSAAIQELRKIGTEAALKEADRLAENGLNYDPQKKFDLLEMERANGQVDQTLLDSLYRTKTISDAEYKQFSRGSKGAESAKEVDKFLKGIKAGMKSAMQGTVPSGSINPAVSAELTVRHSAFMEDLRRSVLAEVKLRPSLAKDNIELSRVVEEKSQFLLKQPQYKMEMNPKGGAHFVGSLDAGRRADIITVAPGVQDFSKLKPEELFDGRFPKSIMDATKDRFLSLDKLRTDVKLVLAGSSPSNTTRLVAKNLGLSPSAFINSQLEVNGLPGLNAIREGQAKGNGLPSRDDIPNAQAGMSVLQEMGFPRLGAAYLAGNIQQESAWNGRRSWDIGHIDGTDRNGGLVSWQNTAATNHYRLRAAEQYFGKDISKVSEADQLAYMVVEMKRRNPAAYRTFMNPNASEGDLKKASYAYWGYGEPGSRYSYAKRLLQTGRL
jgi:hypothetical protein